MSPIASGSHSPDASLRNAAALNFKIGATRSIASPLKSPPRIFRTASVLTLARSANWLSEIPSPRCALPMMSETLSSSGIAMRESAEGLGVAQGWNSFQRNLLNSRRDCRRRVGLARFFFDRGHRDVRDSTGNDLIER